MKTQRVIQLQTFDEFDEEMQQKIIEKSHDINTDYGWWSYTISSIKEACASFGFDVHNVYFDLGRGDYCHLCGSYYYKKGMTKASAKHTEYDEDLRDLVQQLQAEQKRRFYSLYASINNLGQITTEDERCSYPEYPDELKEILYHVQQWALSILKSEYEHLTSDEAIRETLIANEYLFDLEGNMQ